MKNIYVVTAYTDEAQMPEMKRSLNSQVDVNVHHHIISGKDILSAPRMVYEASKEAINFDAVIELDADMTLTHPKTLALILSWLSRNPGVDRLTLPVRDYYQGQYISGVHTFRPLAVPSTAVVAFPNPDSWLATIKGHLLYGLKCNLVDHSFNPSHTQAIRYGLQRGYKALANGARHRHWISLRNLELHYKRYPKEKGLSYAMLGALIGIGAIELPIEVSGSVVNYADLQFNVILEYCVQQEKRGFPALNNRKSILQYNVELFNTRSTITNLLLRSAKIRLLIERDRLFRDDLSSE